MGESSSGWRSATAIPSTMTEEVPAAWKAAAVSPSAVEPKPAEFSVAPSSAVCREVSAGSPSSSRSASGSASAAMGRSEEHTSELQSLMRISYAVFCLKKKRISILLAKLLRHLDYTHLMIHDTNKILIS